MKSFYDRVIGQGPTPGGFLPAGKLSLEKAFEVYRNGYLARLTDMLGDTFEMVWKVLGDELFFEVSKAFILETPSENYDLSNYSRNFISFLKTHQISAEFPFLADLASMGWMQKDSFNAPMETGLAGEKLLGLLEMENGKGRFVAHFQIMKSKHCIFDLWNSLNEGQEPPSDWQVPQAVAFYKIDNGVYLKKLELGLFAALERIQSGENLMMACEDLGEEDLTALFHFLAKNALISI